TMWLSRRNENAVADFNPLRLASHRHQPTAFEDEVDLLWSMAVNPLLATRLNHSKSCGQKFGAAGPRRGQQVRNDPFRASVPGPYSFLEDMHRFVLIVCHLLYFLRHGNERIPSPHGDRPPHLPPAAVAH